MYACVCVCVCVRACVRACVQPLRVIKALSLQWLTLQSMKCCTNAFALLHLTNTYENELD